MYLKRIYKSPYHNGYNNIIHITYFRYYLSRITNICIDKYFRCFCLYYRYLITRDSQNRLARYKN